MFVNNPQQPANPTLEQARQLLRFSYSLLLAPFNSTHITIMIANAQLHAAIERFRNRNEVPMEWLSYSRSRSSSNASSQSVESAKQSLKF